MADGRGRSNYSPPGGQEAEKERERGREQGQDIPFRDMLVTYFLQLSCTS